MRSTGAIDMKNVAQSLGLVGGQDTQEAPVYQFLLNAWDERVQAAVRMQKAFRRFRKQSKDVGWPSDQNPYHWKHFVEVRRVLLGAGGARWGAAARGRRMRCMSCTRAGQVTGVGTWAPKACMLPHARCCAAVRCMMSTAFVTIIVYNGILLAWRRKKHGWTQDELYDEYGEPRERTDGGRATGKRKQQQQQPVGFNKEVSAK